MRKNKRNLDYDQCYENFIICKENDAIHSLFDEESFKTMAIKSPIFITGDYGSGKSHLLNAFHIFAMGLYPEKKIIHMNAEQYVNDNIYKISRRGEHRLYSEADILIVDDLQYLVDKPVSQSGLSYVLRDLLDRGIIVLAAFENLKSLKSFEEGLRGVLLSGMHIDLVPLDEVSQKKLEKRLEKVYIRKSEERFRKFLEEPEDKLRFKKPEKKELSKDGYTCSICNTHHNTEIDRENCMNSHSELLTLRWLAYKLSLIKDDMGDEIESIDKDIYNLIDSIISRFGISVDEFLEFA